MFQGASAPQHQVNPMKIRLLPWLTTSISLALCAPASAENLVKVYQQALLNDPTFKQAKADWLSSAQNLPIAEAALFPTLGVTGGASRNYSKSSIAGVSTSGYYNNMNYGISISEPIFNLANWSTIRGASAQSKSAAATYLAAKQDLINRTATAYFNVLKAASQLRFTLASKNSFWQQLVTSQQKYKVGLIAITPVYDAQAKYDSAVASEITDRNAVDNALENLRAITGHLYPSLSALKTQVPLYIPKPQNIDSWVNIALAQNYSIKAQRFSLLAAKAAISTASNARYPTVDLTGSYTVNTYSNSRQTANPNTNAGAVGLSLNFPFYQGGLISANTKQAKYNYLSSSAALEFQRRSVTNNTRQAYLGIVAGVSGVKADKQAVVSNQNSLKATKAGYAVGTRTMVNLLEAMSQLYQAQKNYMQDQYNYILSLVQLKQQAGTLGEKDLGQINSWLKQNVKLVHGQFRNTYTPLHPNKKAVRKNTATNPERKARSGDLPRVSPATIGQNQQPKTSPATQANKKQRSASSKTYTIQLYASHTGKSAEQFIQQHALKGKVKLVKQNGYYKVMMGQYRTKTLAANAKRQLPVALTELGAWVAPIQG